MKINKTYNRHFTAALLALVVAGLGLREMPKYSAAKAGIAKPRFYKSSDFLSAKKYDTHVHLNVDDSTFVEQAKADNFRLLTVNVTPAYYPPIREQRSIAMQLTSTFPARLSWATTFSLEGWGEPGWQQNTLKYLQESFDKGAIAVKVWKNIGMELRDRNGKFVMIDDPRFDFVIEYIAARHITLIGHLGEPKNAWLPLEEMTIKSNQNYFSKHPEYHMYLHPEYPSYDEQVRARDHMLEKHPGLRFVGAHLGSLEWSIKELAKRLDRFPNMAVDMAARLSALQYQAVTDWKGVRDFFIKYQDRLVYATDLEAGTSGDAVGLKKRMHDTWLRDWNFIVADTTMHSPAFDASFRSLRLPASVVDKIYCTNAEKWFPGIIKQR